MTTRTPIAAACALAWATAAADPQLLTITASDEPSDFFQLESSGRKNIAADDRRVGLVWEETHGGHSTAYLAFKPVNQDEGFGEADTLGDQDAFNPVIAACGGRFYVAWIEADSVRATVYEDGKHSPVTQVAEGPVNELTIGCRADNALLAWSQRAGRGYAVEASLVKAQGGNLTAGAAVAVAATETYRFQTNPGVAFANNRVIVTWHDRTGGTNLLYASSGTDLEHLDKQVQINELIRKSYEWGSGSSAVRNALAVGRKQRLVAVWLDKRASRAGYKVYSAFSDDGGVSWGDNYNIVDEWGTIVPQWTPAVASNGDDRVRVVWMDAREDTNTIWTSELNGLTWSANASLSGDAGDTHSPVIAYSPDGTLHAAWIEKDNGASRIRYFSERD
jgi:hypothetical protein